MIAAKPVERRHDARGSGGDFRASRAAQGCRAEIARDRGQSRPARRIAGRPGSARRGAAAAGARGRALSRADRPDPRWPKRDCSSRAGPRPTAPREPRRERGSARPRREVDAAAAATMLGAQALQEQAATVLAAAARRGAGGARCGAQPGAPAGDGAGAARHGRAAAGRARAAGASRSPPTPRARQALQRRCRARRSPRSTPSARRSRRGWPMPRRSRRGSRAN